MAVFNSRLRAVVCNSNTPTQLLSQSSDRYGFWLFPSPADNAVIRGDSNISPNFDVGISSSWQPLWFCVTVHGYFVQQELWCQMATKTEPIGIIEAMACDCESRQLLKDAFGHISGDKEYHEAQARAYLSGAKTLPQRAF